MMRSLMGTLFLALAFVLTGCGGGGGGFGDGGAGVSNGGIVGNIRGIGELGTLPIAGAFVTVSRQIDPMIIRSTRSDGNGDFVFSDLPVGPYSMEASANGFIPRSFGNVVFVEPGFFSEVGPVTLDATLAIGNSNLVVTVLDAVTGEPIENALVTAGIASTSRGSGGVYSLSVPVSSQGSAAPAVGLSVQAGGYDPATVEPRSVTIVPGQLVSVIARVRPLGGQISGRVRISSFEGIFTGNGALSTVSIQIPDVPSSYSQGFIDTVTGEFVINVPATSSTNPRTFTLTFVSPYFEIAIVPGIVAPVGGRTRLASDVVLVPIGVGLTGTVLTSSGTFPGGTAADTATLVELGRSVSIVAGRYSFPGIPVGTELTLRLSAFNAVTNRVETAAVPVAPISTTDGSFVIPTVITR